MAPFLVIITLLFTPHCSNYFINISWPSFRPKVQHLLQLCLRLHLTRVQFINCNGIISNIALLRYTCNYIMIIYGKCI